MNVLASYRDVVRNVELTRRIGYVQQILGLAVEAEGPDVGVGEMCGIARQAHSAHGIKTGELLAEVVSVRPGRVTLMPYGSVEGLSVGAEVVARGRLSQIGVGDGLLGRTIDGFGNPLDGLPMPQVGQYRPLRSAPLNPMLRPRIDSVMETGIRAIDGLLTIGRGQRVGIFAGSGVGKSTLLGAIVRNADAQVRVIALIGERGREVREFIEKQIGPQGLKSTVIVVATSDQPALSRLRAAYAALAIAEHFRDQGKQVLLTMDSVTRLAMARREVGLSSGEPPTARGYTPSVFAELPELCERCGTSDRGGAITALFTVLVDGDDLNEPISDSLRAILDGHIVLSRQIANRGQYPAIDVLKSASRLMSDLTTPEQRQLATEAIRILDVLERNRQMIDIGAYEKGSSPEIDHALTVEKPLRNWLRQGDEGMRRLDALRALVSIVGVEGGKR
jgi:flagellum-specific ATP synthase